jgi:hypothetical protein
VRTTARTWRCLAAAARRKASAPTACARAAKQRTGGLVDCGRSARSYSGWMAHRRVGMGMVALPRMGSLTARVLIVRVAGMRAAVSCSLAHLASHGIDCNQPNADAGTARGILTRTIGTAGAGGHSTPLRVAAEDTLAAGAGTYSRRCH